jgi:hypothetical protein
MSWKWHKEKWHLSALTSFVNTAWWCVHQPHTTLQASLPSTPDKFSPPAGPPEGLTCAISDMQPVVSSHHHDMLLLFTKLSLEQGANNSFVHRLINETRDSLRMFHQSIFLSSPSCCSISNLIPEASWIECSSSSLLLRKKQPCKLHLSLSFKIIVEARHGDTHL